MGFQQATIKVEREGEFGELRDAITSACAAENAAKFLKAIEKAGLRVRDLYGVVARGVLDKLDTALTNSGRSSQQLYGTLTTFDQGQLREFYLSKIEELDPKLREKFKKLYQYY